MAVPLSLLQRIQAHRARSGFRKASGTAPNRSEQAKYRLQLQTIVKALQDSTQSELFGLLRRLEPEFTQESVTNDSVLFMSVKDAYAGEINRAIRRMASRARNITGLSERIAAEWANGVNNKQRRQFYRAIERSIGVNLNGIVQEPGIADVLDSKISENVSLIQSLPDEYYKKINTIVNDLTSRRHPANSIIKELRKAGIQTQKRAKLIARDQTQKLNAAITQSRQEALGIEEYEWQTSGDERVRDTHRRKNGKIFRWDDPPADTGHPGEDIQCRCVALPIINLDNVNR